MAQRLVKGIDGKLIAVREYLKFTEEIRDELAELDQMGKITSVIARIVEQKGHSFRKEANTTSFKRDVKTITFSVGDESYPIKGGEQDRASIQWQIAAQARAAPDKFKPGSEFAYFVAGRRDADQWSFKVANVEPVQTGGGEVSAVHLVRQPLDDDKGSQVDLWLAPSLDWYPVRVVFKDADGDFVDQTLDKVIKK